MPGGIYIRTIEHRKKQSESLKKYYINHNSPFKGKKWSIKEKKMLSKFTKIAMQKPDIKERYLAGLKTRNTPRGKNHSKWKGGITPLVECILHSLENQDWKIKVFERDGFICQECFVKGKRLNAHHKKHFNIIFKEFLQEYNQFSPIEDKEILLRLALNYKPFWDVTNGITVCKECHFKIYHKERK